MEARIKARYEDGLNAPLSWSPTDGGRRAFICFEDNLTAILGLDASGERFQAIAKKIMAGEYYPRDAVQFFGRFQDENRPIQPGDRIQQRAPLWPLPGSIYFWSMVEIYVAELGSDRCKIGYVTTEKHHGRGIWTATLTRQDEELKLNVVSTASPNSFLFWAGLPFARMLQLRARRRAIDEFRKL